MLLGLVTTGLLLLWLMTSWALARAFDDFGRAVVLDDLGEYQAVYEQGGVEAVRSLFAAGSHVHDQILRIVDASRGVLLDLLQAGHPELVWPELSAVRFSGDGETTWLRHQLPSGLTLTVGRRRLGDGGELWFGRSNAVDVEAIERVHRLIALTLAATAVLGVGPALWFAHGVLRPLRALIADARRLVAGGPTIQRLSASGGIPELRELAAAFNRGLDQVHLVTGELEAANDQLAHELRTPLARIRGNIEKALTLSDSPAAADHAARAISELERATRLIQAILTIRAGEARTLKLELGPVRLEDLAATTVDLYTAAAGEKQIALHLEADGSACVVWGDRDRLQQALCNLLDNALAYTPRGGRVQVAVRREGRFGVVSVADTGAGLSKPDVERIWQRFTRGSAASAEVPGIGLGLSVVRSILRAHEGEAGAANGPEGGAEFWIRIPLTPPPLEPASR